MKFFKSLIFFSISFLVFGLLLQGCSKIRDTPSNPSYPTHNTPTTFAASEFSSDDKNQNLEITNTPENEVTPPVIDLLETVEPINFSFPTPAPAPISHWRPPLYDTPWSLAPYDHFYFSRPIAADEINWPLANYRYGGIFFSTDIVHTGIDIPAPRGTPVIAAADGEIVWTGYGLFYGTDTPDDPYGLAVNIKHNFGFDDRRLYSVYAHLDRIDINTGDFVTAGTQIGIVGNTGKTTGPHLHFEIRIQENNFYASRNPELWLAPPQGWGVLVGQLRNTNGSFLTEQLVRVTSLETDFTWEVISYGHHTVNRDEYYQENLVLSDLPAGRYRIKINYLDEMYTHYIEINPGAITYFHFYGENGYDDELPAQSEFDMGN